MSVSVEAVVPTVSAHHIPPYRGGHSRTTLGSGVPLCGSGGGSGGGRGGGLGGEREQPLRQRGLDVSHSWSPSPTSVVSGDRGRGGQLDSGVCVGENGTGGASGGGRRGMPPGHHAEDSVGGWGGAPGASDPLTRPLPTPPSADLSQLSATGQAGPCSSSDGGAGGIDGGGGDRRPAEKRALLRGGAASPVSSTNPWLPPLPPSADAVSPGRPARPEPFAYSQVPPQVEQIARGGGDGGATVVASGHGSSTPGAPPGGLLLSAGAPTGLGCPSPLARGIKGDRRSSSELSPLTGYPSAPEMMVSASPAAGDTKQPQGTPRFLSSLASRMQVMAEHGSAVTARRARMGGTLRRAVVGVIVILMLVTLASFFWLHATSIRRTSRRLLLIYIHILRARPLVSRAISAGFIFLSADFLAQRLASSTTPFDYIRLLRYSSYGLVVMGPFLYLWYSVMHLYGPDDTLVGAAQKALFEQITLEPLCIGGYMIWDGAARRRPMAEVRSRLRTQFWGLLLKNAVFWVPANFSNYAAGTPDLRVLYANLCSLFWNVYFSAFVNSLPDLDPGGPGGSAGAVGKGRRTSPSPAADDSCGV